MIYIEKTSIFLTGLMGMDKLGRLMSPDLPQFIDPLRFAKVGRQLAGQYEIKEMERLRTLLFEDCGQVSFELKFGQDKENEIFFVEGHVESRLLIICQRCLEGLELQVNNPIKLGIVSSKNEAEKLPSNYEPLVIVDDSVSLLEMIEDELLLALPIAALHDTKKCSTNLQNEEDIFKRKVNPLAGLEKLKKKTRKS